MVEYCPVCGEELSTYQVSYTIVREGIFKSDKTKKLTEKYCLKCGWSTWSTKVE